MQESDFYKVELPEQPSDKIVERYAYMPDGSIYSGDDIRHNLHNLSRNANYGVFYLSPMGWRCFHTSNEKDDVIMHYGRIVRNPTYTMFKMLYPCIAKIYDANEKVKRPVTVTEYEDVGINSKIKRLDITKELSDNFIKHTKKKIYCKDCVLVKCDNKDIYLGLTRYYGKYYSLGIMTKEEGEAYSNEEQLKPKNPLFGTIKTEPGRHLDWMTSYALGMMNSFPYSIGIDFAKDGTMVNIKNGTGKTIKQGDVVMTPDATVTIKQSSLRQMQDKIAANNAEVKRLNATINDLNNKNRALHELSNRRDKVEMAKKIDSLNSSIKSMLHDLEQIKTHNQDGCTKKLCLFAEAKLDYIIQNITSILKQ